MEEHPKQARIVHADAAPVQSGPARDREWIVEFEPAVPPEIDPLMGWTGSCDPAQQVRLFFSSREAAEAYCRRAGLEWVLQPEHRKPRRRSYAENFVPLEGEPKPIYPH